MRYSSKAIIINKKRILMLRRSKDNRWHFPGGGLNDGESFSQGLRREIKEELRTTIKSYKDVKVVKTDDEYTVMFKVTLASDKIRLSFEHNRLAWIPVKSISKLDLTSNAKTIVKALQKSQII